MDRNKILFFKSRAMSLKKSLVYDDFVHILFPALLFALVEYVLQLSDSIIAGNLFGEKALAGITLCKPYLSFITFLSMLILPGTSMFAAHAIGKENRSRANFFFGQGILLSVSIGVFLSAASFLLKSQILSLFKVSGDMLAYTSQYFNGLLLQPLLMFYPVLFAAVIGEGGKKWCTISAITLLIANVFLSITLGRSIGMMGLSLGTVISLAIASAVLLLQFKEKNNPLKLMFKVRRKDTIKVLSSGIMVAIIFYLSLTLLYLFFNWFLLNRFNTDAIIIFTVVVNLQSFYVAIYSGISQAGQPMISIYRGEVNFAGILKSTRVITYVTTLLVVVLTAIIYLFAGSVPLMFGVTEPELVHACTRAIRIYAWASIFIVWGFLLSDYLLNANYNFYPSLIVFSILFLFAIPLTYILGSPSVWGLNGVWAAISISFLLGFIFSMSLLYLKSRKRKFCFPWMLSKKVLNNQASFDVPATKKNVKVLMDAVEKELIKRGFEQKRILKVLLMLEETYMLNYDKSKTDRKYYVECTLLFKRKLLMYIRSNGEYSNATDVNAMPDSLRQYLSSMIVSSHNGSRFSLSVGDNRSVFEF